MVTTTIATLKGGDGKTFTSALLCRELAKMGKVLAVSICSQNNLNIYLGADVGEYQLYHAIRDENIKDAIYPTMFKNIDIVPYNIDKVPSIDIELQSKMGRERILKLLLDQVKNNYDYAVLDTGPNLNLSTINAFVASDYLISPMQMEESSFDGYIATTNALNEMVHKWDMSHCKQLGIVVNKDNICRNKETFLIEEKVDNWEKNGNITKLGHIPYMASLRHALYQFEEYNDAVPAHNIDKVKETMSNITSLIV